MTAGPLFLACFISAAGVAPAEGADFIPDRHFTIPISKPDPARLAEVTSLDLQMSTDEGHTWGQKASVPPNTEEFSVNVPQDGLYWFSVGMVDRANNRYPPGPAQDPKPLKIYVDTVKPQANLLSAVRQGEEILLQWTLQEDYPDPSKSRIEYRTVNMPANVWNPAPVAMDPVAGQASFRPGSDYALSVRLHIEDRAGNVVETQPVNVTGSTPPPPNHVAGPVGPAPIPGGGVPTPREKPWSPDAAVAPAQPQALPVAMQRTVPDQVLGGAPNPTGGTPPGGQGTALQPNRNVVASTAKNAEVRQIAMHSPTAPPPSTPPATGPANLPALRYVNSTRVTVEFTISQVGSSGVSEVQVYLTKDKGQTWEPWSQVQPVNPTTAADPVNTPQATALRKAIQVDLPNEGIYGLYLIVKSGVGRSKPPPAPGTAPHVLFEVDLTTPEANLFEPESEGGRTDRLLFTWEVTERNLTDKPILLEWSENKDGPWNPISGDLPNVPNRFVWKMPENLPAQVYIRMTVRDKAGNFGIAQSEQPLQVDLSMPSIDNAVIIIPGTR